MHRPLVKSPKADGFPCMASAQQSIFPYLSRGFSALRPGRLCCGLHVALNPLQNHHQGFGSVLNALMGLARAYRSLKPEGSPAGRSKVF